jgi:hypothetical protein
MTQIKIFAYRKTTAKATVSKLATFDNVTGSGLNVNHPRHLSRAMDMSTTPVIARMQ